MDENRLEEIFGNFNPQDIKRRTKYVIANKQMVEHELKVNVMVRQEPNDPWDSGWRFLYGNETDEILARTDEFFDCYNPSDILYKGNEAISKFLDAPFGSWFVRKDDDFISDEDSESEKQDLQVIDLSTKDTSELKELLAEYFDLKPTDSKTSAMSREEYIDSMVDKISRAPQLLYDETIDLLNANIQKQKTLNDEIARRIAAEEERKREQEKEERLHRKILTCIMIATWLLLLIPIVVTSGYLIYIKGKMGAQNIDTLLSLCRTGLAGSLICGVLFSLHSFLCDRSTHGIVKGVLYAIISVAAISLGIMLR